MRLEEYTLDIISLDREGENKRLKKYDIDGVDFIGVQENEPFEIRLKNNTPKKVQARVSVDGTDVLSGEIAGTDPVGEMWLINPYSTLRLKAWPESNNGGARFLFTNTDNSVAANTHGDLRSKGVIAIAVFKEGEEFEDEFHTELFSTRISANPTKILRRGVRSVNKFDEELGLAGVGAGEFSEQKLKKVAGLSSPVLSETAVIRYKWWSSLRSDLRKISKEASSNGFPADEKRFDLGNTPRLKSTAKSRPRRGNYPEFNRFA